MNEPKMDKLDIALIWINAIGPLSIYFLSKLLSFNISNLWISKIAKTFPRTQVDLTRIEQWYSIERAAEHVDFFTTIISLHILLTIVSIIIRIAAIPFIGLKIDKTLLNGMKNYSYYTFLIIVCFTIALATLVLFPSFIDQNPKSHIPEPNSTYAYFLITLYTTIAGTLIYALPMGVAKIVKFNYVQNT